MNRRWKIYSEIDKNTEDKLEGLLLGDGSLKIKSSRSGSFSQTCSYLDVIKSIKSLLRFESRISQQRKKENYIRGKLIRASTHWRIDTLSYPELLMLRKKWYPNNKKTVPSDIRLSPVSCYWWFLGDGYVGNSQLVFCTECFDDNSLNILKTKLSNILSTEIGIDYRRRIVIYANGIEAFYNYIGECKHQDYAYKWKRFDYKERFKNRIPRILTPLEEIRDMARWISTLKECTICSIYKPRTKDFFHKNKRNRDGLLPKCKVCS